MAKDKPIGRREKERREKQAQAQFEKNHPLSYSGQAAIDAVLARSTTRRIHIIPYATPKETPW